MSAPTREEMQVHAAAWVDETLGPGADRDLLIVWVSGWVRGFCRLVPPHRLPSRERDMAINDLSWDLEMWTAAGGPVTAAASALLSAAGWMP